MYGSSGVLYMCIYMYVCIYYIYYIHTHIYISVVCVCVDLSMYIIELLSSIKNDIVDQNE